MCYFITTIHTYSECLLQHTASRSTTETVPGADPGPAPNLTTTERIIRSVNNLLYPPRADAVPVVVDPGPSNKVVDTELREDEFHHITRRTYFQCSQARNAAEGSELWETPKEQRICSNAVEVEDLAEDDEVPSSAKRGACPICKAVEKIIVDESKTKIIKEAKDNLETIQSSLAHLHPKRRTSKNKRYVHHGPDVDTARTRPRDIADNRPRETTGGRRSGGRTQGKPTAEGGSHKRGHHRNGANRFGGKDGNDSGCICM